MREHLRHNEHALDSYFQALGEPGVHALKLLLASNTAPLPDERGVLRAIARDLHDALPEPRANALPSPGNAVRSEIALLAEHYRAKQAGHVKTLASHHGEGPCLRRAWYLLRKGGLLDTTTLDQLPQDAVRDIESRGEQRERREVYLAWRERAARGLARKAGPLGRLTHRAEDYYAQLDHKRLRVCTRCGETIYPRAREAGSYGSPRVPRCHYCREAHGSRPYDITSNASKESEAYQ